MRYGSNLKGLHEVLLYAIYYIKKEKDESKSMAPDVGFEPTTKRLTAAYSTAELIWNFAQKQKEILVCFL